jgi:exopolysaccharide production protein ExoQ
MNMTDVRTGGASSITTSRSGIAPRPSLVARWPVFLPILLMVVSDYDWRQRSVTESLSGRPDIAVLFEVAVYGVAGLFLLDAYIRHPGRVHASPAIVALWGFGVTMFVSAALAPFPVMGIVRGVQLLVMCLLAAMLSSTVTREHVSDTLHLFVIVVAASVAFGVVFRFPPVSSGTVGRFTWLYVHPVISGVYLAVAVVILLALSLRPSGQVPWPRFVYVVMLCVVSFALYRNVTRGSIAGAVVGVLVVVIVAAPRRTRLVRMVTVGAGVAFMVLLLGRDILNYLARGESAEKLSTLNSRTDLWELAWRYFSQRPMSGWGLGATRGLFLQSLGLGGGHNAFVNVLVDGGIAGMFWWLATLVCLVVAARKLARVAGWREDVPVIAGIFSALVVNSITTEGLGAVANVSSLWLVVLIGWCAGGLQSRFAGPNPQAATGKHGETGLQRTAERVSSRSVSPRLAI